MAYTLFQFLVHRYKSFCITSFQPAMISLIVGVLILLNRLHQRVHLYFQRSVLGFEIVVGGFQGVPLLHSFLQRIKQGG